MHWLLHFHYCVFSRPGSLLLPEFFSLLHLALLQVTEERKKNTEEQMSKCFSPPYLASRLCPELVISADVIKGQKHEDKKHQQLWEYGRSTKICSWADMSSERQRGQGLLQSGLAKPFRSASWHPGGELKPPTEPDKSTSKWSRNSCSASQPFKPETCMPSPPNPGLSYVCVCAALKTCRSSL